MNGQAQTDVNTWLPWQTSAWKQTMERTMQRRLPHALLLSGIPGVGKHRFALALAQQLLCQTPDGTGGACGQCAGCAQFHAGSHPDYHYLTLAEDKSRITVPQLRDLIAALTLTSQHGGYRIAIIEPAEAMNTAAANALLKTLEEPGADTLIMLVTAHPARLPATIRSRCQRLSMPTPEPALALGWLEQQQSRADWPVLLELAGGGPLAALRLAEAPEMTDRLALFRSLEAIRSGQQNPLPCAREWSAKETDLPLILRLFQSWLMDLIRCASGVADTVSNRDAQTLLQSAAQGINLPGLHIMLARINRAIALLGTTVNRQLLLEGLLVAWADGLDTLAAQPLATGE